MLPTIYRRVTSTSNGQASSLQRQKDSCKSTSRSSFPDSYVVAVDAVYDGPRERLRCSYLRRAVTEAVESIASGELEVDCSRSQEVVIGTDVPTAATTQRDRSQDIRGIIEALAEQFDDGAPIAAVVKRAHLVGIGQDKAEHEIETLKQQGEVYEPRTDHLRTT
ncbi:hypothetical protein [Haloarcula nitratireducens]|uniref:MCM C-terminal domain-containing protein n=1 Tax=Haloarcula nitratireducens TaxID=2487749 RepID=A0AAW4PH82_9EURY|nr:hypothetical protein [Halomicroarcula nitratireducens]MBX0296800.1 hypothetical protein [Halomicroarcula nitratireducens]